MFLYKREKTLAGESESQVRAGVLIAFHRSRSVLTSLN